MVLLDGVGVVDKIIDPAKHRYIGMFRYPFAVPTERLDCIVCSCLTNFWTIEQLRQHWQLGHYDTPQYVTIKDE
jgi:hypothetical protein